jgi:hypothetical protein
MVDPIALLFTDMIFTFLFFIINHGSNPHEFSAAGPVLPKLPQTWQSHTWRDGDLRDLAIDLDPNVWWECLMGSTMVNDG